MLNRRDAGEEGYSKCGREDRRRQERRDAGKQGCRNDGMKEKRYSRDEGSKFSFHTCTSTVL